MARDAKGNAIEFGDYVSAELLYTNGDEIGGEEIISRERGIARVIALKESAKGSELTVAFVEIGSKIKLCKSGKVNPANCTLVMKADGTVPEVEG